MAKSESTTSDLVAPETVPEGDRLARADRLTKHHVLMSVGAGLVPGPGLDLAASFAIQLSLLARLSKLYGVPYSDNVGKGIVYSLFGSLGGIAAGGTVAMSAAKFVPVVGTAVGVVGMPVVMGAFTHAVGKVFTQHFESGGTFLDFDAASYRQYFRDMFKQGKTLARRARAEAKTDTALAEQPVAG